MTKMSAGAPNRIPERPRSLDRALFLTLGMIRGAKAPQTEIRGALIAPFICKCRLYSQQVSDPRLA